MKHWTTTVLVACAAAVAVAQWFAPSTASRVMSVLLFALVVTTAFSQRRTLVRSRRSLEAAHREQIESERQYRALFDSCSDAIFAYTIEADGQPGTVVEANESACRFLGYSRRELLHMTGKEIAAPEVRRELVERSRSLLATHSLLYESVYLTAGGDRLTVEVAARLVELRGCKLCLAVARDIAARKEREELWQGMSHEDELTGLLNRRGLFAAVERAARKAHKLGARALVMYVDVDGLKRVNDHLGHAAGDKLVLAAAQTLRVTFREGDVLARVGDEFVALAILSSGADETLDRQTIEGRFASAVAAKRVALGDDYAFSLSYGCLVADSDELGHFDDLLARSDERMYEAKRNRSGQSPDDVDEDRSPAACGRRR